MKLIGYGANIAALNVIRTSRINLDFIVDDNESSHGTTLADVPIYPSSALSTVDWNTTRLIVCAYNPRSIIQIQSKLELIGLNYLEHWIDCSVFYFNTIGTKLKEVFRIAPDPLLFWRTRALILRCAPDNMSSIAGTWLFIELLRHLAAKQNGGVAEMGVFRGGNAFVTLALGPDPTGWKYHLFDSFTGLPELSTYDPISRGGEFTDTSLAHIHSMFSDYDNVIIHAGLFSDTLESVATEYFNIVYVDCDLYEPTLECCDFYYNRLNQGGIMLFHDYFHASAQLPSGCKKPFTGVRLAVDEYFRNRPEKVIHFPETTHALIIKQ